MRLSLAIVNEQVNALATRLDGGAVRFSAADDVLLAHVPLPSPAFHDAIDGRALSRELPKVVIQATGEAVVGQFMTAAGELVGDFLVRTADAPDADQADAILDRTDFHRGGTLEVPLLMLKLPQQP